ncbi:MAG: anti-sigma factor antagonist [bacterium]|nr:anti-sigma factor antagonist [bacterium]
MNEEFQVVKSCLMIRMPREVDHHQARRIRETADRYIERREISHVIFDFGITEFMDSSGIGVIMGRYKKMEILGGKVLAIHVNGGLRRIFKISGLHKVIEVVEEDNHGGNDQ